MNSITPVDRVTGSGAMSDAPTAPADPEATQQFSTLMNQQAAPGLEPATDEELLQLPAEEVQALRTKWGADDASFRLEAKELLLVRENLTAMPLLAQAKKLTEKRPFRDN
ncbi:MAG: hypothetical protein Q8N17_00615 [Burkholderiaceae bacterium]|nr:hypothetical protein [Burkholderiaceae bacterium]